MIIQTASMEENEEMDRFDEDEDNINDIQNDVNESGE